MVAKKALVRDQTWAVAVLSTEGAIQGGNKEVTTRHL